MYHCDKRDESGLYMSVSVHPPLPECLDATLRRLMFNLRVLVLAKAKNKSTYSRMVTLKYSRHVLVVSCPCQLDLRFKVDVANQRAAQSRLTKAIALIGRWSGESPSC